MSTINNTEFRGTPVEVGGALKRTSLPALPRELLHNQGVQYTASLYFPDILPKSASRALRQEIANYPALRDALLATNWQSTKRYFTPLQQQIIVHYLGLPM